VDLKATFKTVAVTKQMIVSDLVASALKKFRIPKANVEEYYIGVLHMDSRIFILLIYRGKENTRI
jgi:hypothetical protein